jgi:hypothetical protein
MLSPGEHPCAGNCIGGVIALYVPCFNIYAFYAARAAIRKKYNIDGGCVDDLLCGCSLCGLIQVWNIQSVQIWIYALYHITFILFAIIIIITTTIIIIAIIIEF